jgi:hypothetical protein
MRVSNKRRGLLHEVTASVPRPDWPVWSGCFGLIGFNRLRATWRWATLMGPFNPRDDRDVQQFASVLRPVQNVLSKSSMAALPPAAPTRHMVSTNVVSTQGMDELSAAKLRP